MSSLDLQIESVGSELEDKDLEIVKGFAATLTELYAEKERLEKYVDGRMTETAPNITAIVGPSLGARLISLAGGLKRLSQLPAGTVQLLGAEKAMFMHLKAGKRPPKHGVIFQHPTVHRAPYWQRGNISRSMAAKISIASKVDYWKGEFIGDQLNAQIAKRVEEVQRKYPDPPKKEQRRLPPKGEQWRDQGRNRNDHHGQTGPRPRWPQQRR